jgi:hypothetical protein
MIRRIASLVAVLTLASATSALAAPPPGHEPGHECTLVGLHGEARSREQEHSSNSPNVNDPLGLCNLAPH